MLCFFLPLVISIYLPIYLPVSLSILLSSSSYRNILLLFFSLFTLPFPSYAFLSSLSLLPFSYLLFYFRSSFFLFIPPAFPLFLPLPPLSFFLSFSAFLISLSLSISSLSLPPLLPLPPSSLHFLSVPTLILPFPSLSRLKDGQPISLDGKHYKQVEGPDGTVCLQIDAATEGDTGEITCVAKNPEGDSTSKATLSVLGECLEGASRLGGWVIGLRGPSRVCGCVLRGRLGYVGVWGCSD